MNTKRLMCMLMTCTLTLLGVIPPARAAEAPGEVIWLEDLEWEWIDLSTVDGLQGELAPQASVSVNKNFAGNSTQSVTSFLSFKANDVVAFSCSYSPSSASMDFGVIASSGRFYSINVKGGSIRQSVRINQTGSYAVAVRNNSSQTVRVVGFVNY